MKITIGIDNGTTGSVAIVGGSSSYYGPVPVKETVSHVKSKGFAKRIDRAALFSLLHQHCIGSSTPDSVDIRVYVEAPFTMPVASEAVLLGHRAFEAVLCVFEDLSIPVETCMPRDWQPTQLGAAGTLPIKNVRGTAKADTKKASLLKGIALYPQLESAIREQGDADGLLIAHHYHKKR
jgi:hypothetical protein